MTELHVAIAGWLLGPASGANRRLLRIAEHAASMLRAGERITVLHGPGFTPPAASAVAWHHVPINAAPTLKRSS